ncbi:EhaG family protein [Methanocaldococcus sp. 16A]
MDIITYFYHPTILIGFAIGILSLLAIGFQKDDLHALILTDIIECAMLIIIAGVDTDLAEALILPGLVVSLAELMAVSEILITKKYLKSKRPKPRSYKLFEEFKLPLHTGELKYNVQMEVLKTSPKFLSIVLIVYGAILSGFTGGAVIATGLLFYALSQRVIGLDISKELKTMWEGISGLSGIAWALWVIGFLGFFLFPDKWLLFLLMAGLGLVIKVGSKLGLIGYIGEVK